VPRVAILGGTGPEGKGLALRFALSGLDVIVGSRVDERARSAAQTLVEKLRAAGCARNVSGMENSAAARSSDLVALAFPYAGVAGLAPDLRRGLAGKIVLDVVNPLQLENGLFHVIPIEAGSAAEDIQRLLPESRVVSAFKHQSAEELRRIDMPLRGDVIVCSDHPEARRRIVELVRGIPTLRPIDAGRLANARTLEPITALLLNLNRQHHAVTSIQILGLPSDP
jgi:hypothetical protein